MELTAEKVNEIFIDSLYDENATDHSKAINVRGITMSIGFDPEKLTPHREEIIGLLMELPDEFRESGGGGWSFLNACDDRHDCHWGEHRSMQELFLLGEAIGMVKSLLPREMWAVLPGGVPYYVILDKKNVETTTATV